MPSDPLKSDERDRLLAQNVEIAELAGGLAHEIKNPLSTIVLNLDLLVEDVEDAESAKGRRTLQRIQRLQQECRHLQSILDDFLAFASAGELDLEECDLNDVVTHFVEFYQPQAKEHGVEISPHLNGDLPAVRLDLAMFRQVLMNLALNAQQAMPEGGLLELQTYSKDDQVCLDFIDSGKGMTPAQLAKMFRVFYSTRAGGSGLGLPTVRKIIRAHGGEMSTESEPGSGTRITVALPTTTG